MPPPTEAKNRTTTTPARLLAACAIDAALEKKAHDVVVMDMRQVSGIADFFVICSGDSDLQIKAIVDAVRARIRERFDERAWHLEGYEHRQWAVVDYVDLVFHAFTREKRAFYDLERLWGDAIVETVPAEGEAADVQILRGPKASDDDSLED